MLLRFYAVEDTLVDLPGGHVVGQPPRYIGREFVPGDEKTRPSHPATKEPFEVDSDSNTGRRLALICRRDGDLFAADEATAAFCGVKLLAIEFKGGAWAEKAAPAKKEQAANG